MKKIGEKINRILEEKKMTQRDLAQKIDLDESTLSRIIKGDRTPNIETLSNIATILHVTTDYLLDIENNTKFDSQREIRLIARNLSKLTREEKKELVNILID